MKSHIENMFIKLDGKNYSHTTRRTGKMYAVPGMFYNAYY